MNRSSGSTPQPTDHLLDHVRSRDRLSRYSFWITILAPTWAALFGPLAEGRGEVWWPRLGCAVTVSVELYVQHRLALRRTLPTRLRLRRRADVWLALTVLLVVSPVGGWLIGWWTALPRTAGLVVPLVLSLLGFTAGIRQIAWSQSGGPQALAGCLFTVVSIPAALLCGDGVLALLLVGFRQPDPELILAAWGVALLSLLRLLHRTSADHDVYGVLNDAAMLRKLPRELVEAAVDDWVRRRALRRPDRLDTSLVLALTSTAQSTAAFSDLKGRTPVPFMPTPTSAQAEMLLGVARSAIDTIAVLAGRDEGRRGPQDKDVLFARGMIQQVHATLAQREQRREEAAAGLSAAGAHYAEAGMPNLAALTRLLANGELCTAFFAPEDALRDLRAVADDESLVGIVRRTAWACAEAMRRVRDPDARPCADPHGGPREVSPAQAARDIAVLHAELPPGIPQLMAMSMRNVLTETLRMAEEMAAHGKVLAKGKGHGFDGLIGAMHEPESLLESAERCVRAGREDQARYLAARAKVVALRYGEFGKYTSACNFLMDLGTRRRQWRAVHHELAQAVEMAELARQQLLAPQRKSEATYAQQLWYGAMVMLLLEGTDGRDWPPPEARARAWELVERSRARALLDVLGETLTIPVDGALEPLVERERAALSRVRALRTQLVSIGGTAVEDADVMARVRGAERELREVQSRIEASGDAGTAYLRLRRGTPIGFAEVRQLLREESGGRLSPG
ncbi:hypothetical protein U5640_40725 [Streptomyces sp. SS7]|uniref:hypothetical protein n=1 Tax=Streptomyces sp. SS7 TaxID=3108485 RepID=UPI0030EF2F8A